MPVICNVISIVLLRVKTARFEVVEIQDEG